MLQGEASYRPLLAWDSGTMSNTTRARLPQGPGMAKVIAASGVKPHSRMIATSSAFGLCTCAGIKGWNSA